MSYIDWLGKDDVVHHHKEIAYKTIDCQEVVGEETSENLIIKGDNLLALKSLLPYCANAVKMIYIDPPYNTGNTSWVYNDNMDSPLIKKWLNSIVKEDDLSGSDKWLCMMYPRLKLLRELLKPNGMIYISIDDAEIVYDKNEEKIRKEEWHFNQLNPKELLLDIESKATELKYFYELPKGLFREKIPQYHPDVIRELLVNSFVHKSYTISGDIFIRIYTDRFEIMNPGGLPLDITKENILHHTRRKNPHIIDIFKALGLMEGEGSGYDKIYEKLSLDAKPFPEIDNDIDYVKVTIFSTIISQDILKLLDYILSHFELTQKEIIALGVIARERKVTAIHLAKLLQLRDDARLRNWVSSLVDKNILVTQGKTKGLTYLIKSKLLSAIDQNIKPSLKTLEPHALKALIYEDLKIHPNSSKNEIMSRLPDINVKEIQKVLYSGCDCNELIKEGATKNRTYSLANKKEIKKKCAT